MSQELEHIWSRVQARLAAMVDEPTYRIWLASLRPIGLENDLLTLEVPAHSSQWIRGRFGRVLRAGAQEVLGPDAAVELVPCGDQRSAALGPASPGDAAITRALSSGPLGNPKLTFDQFVIGDSNRLAHAAALAVAEMLRLF